MAVLLPAFTMVYTTATTIDAAVDYWYIVDTSSGNAVTIYLPSGVAIGHRICIQNAPTNGKQFSGGSNTGATITVYPTGGETIEGQSYATVNAPTSTVTSEGPIFYPVGSASANSGFGAGWCKQ